MGGCDRRIMSSSLARATLVIPFSRKGGGEEETEKKEEKDKLQRESIQKFLES